MTPEKAFWLFAFFATIVFFTGGGSRHDIESVGPLRSVSAIVLAIGVYFQTADTFRRVAKPVIFLVLLAALMVIQLIPLPPSLWSSLAGREAIVAIGQLLGLTDHWRPITFSPMKTANSLASLIVPLAALMVLALLDDKGWSWVRKIIIIAGLVSALLGIAQITLRGSPGLYLYEITNSDSAVGLFSNRNHNALFLNIALLFSLFEGGRISSAKSAAEKLSIIAVDIVLLAAILINGSRFGLVLLAFVALVFAIELFANARASSLGRRATTRQKLTGLVVGSFALGLVIMFASMSRIPALQRVFTQSLDQDQRAQTLPSMLDLLGAHFPYGVGYGAFEQAYRSIEPAELLNPRYLNHAHNDWLQIAIEGGALAMTLILAALFLLAKRGLDLWKTKRGEQISSSAPWLGFLVLAMAAMHSIVDYPLRTPALMLVAAVSVGMIYRPRIGHASASLVIDG